MICWQRLKVLPDCHDAVAMMPFDSLPAGV